MSTKNTEQMVQAPVPTTGWLDLITIKDGVMRIEGWAATFDGTAVDGFEVICGGNPVAPLHVEAGLPSPDVAAAMPAHPLAGSCRFRVTGPAPDGIIHMTNVLVWATPLCQGRRGRGIYCLIDPLLPLPPKEFIKAIGGGFLGVAFEMLGIFIERGRLRPDDRVLDVGCGVGRLAYSLAYHLNAHGRYDGFDVMWPLVEWAARELGGRLPNFRFRHVDVRNRLYNARGTLKPETFRFPYEDASFDFVALISVFTHMRGPEVRHYLDEVARVLAPGGRVLLTAFLLTDEAWALVQQGSGNQPLRHACGGGYAANPRVPESAIGYEDDVLVKWIEESGLRITEICPGSWCGRLQALSYQDVIVVEAGGERRSPRGRGRRGLARQWFGRPRIRMLDSIRSLK
jgi:SAM-dependent methyltransferase